MPDDSRVPVGEATTGFVQVHPLSLYFDGWVVKARHAGEMPMADLIGMALGAPDNYPPPRWLLAYKLGLAAEAEQLAELAVRSDKTHHGTSPEFTVLLEAHDTACDRFQDAFGALRSLSAETEQERQDG